MQLHKTICRLTVSRCFHLHFLPWRLLENLMLLFQVNIFLEGRIIMGYSVQLITPEEKDSLYQSYESRFLYTNKAEIYGCCVKLLNEIEHVKNKREDKFYNR